MKKLILSAIILFIAATSFGQWSLTGNAGTTTDNFIGTTDARDFRIRTKNIDRIFVDTSGFVNTYRDFKVRGLTIGIGPGFVPFTPILSSTAIGNDVLKNNVSGNYNTAVGSSALLSNTTGSYNTAIGTSTLINNINGTNNIAIGDAALYFHKTGSNNTAAGVSALINDSIGFGNTAVGASALWKNKTGKANTAVGDSALFSNFSGNNNTALGYAADVVASTVISNATAIGNGAIANATNRVRIGNTAVTSIGGQVAWTSFSDGRIKKNIKSDVPGLNFVKLLKPVSYNYDLKKQYALEGRTDNTENYEGKDDIEKISFSGFIAQEVDEAAKKIGYSFSGVDKTGNIMGLRYSDFVVPVVKSVQELATENEYQKNEIEELKKENEALKDRLEKVEQFITKYMGNNPNTNIKLQLASLEQNNPNPFNGSTSIAYTLPKNNSGAAINFYAQNGALVKSVKVTGEGRNTITLNRNELAAGIYNYVLVLNGKPADSKQMKID